MRRAGGLYSDGSVCGLHGEREEDVFGRSQLIVGRGNAEGSSFRRTVRSGEIVNVRQVVAGVERCGGGVSFNGQIIPGRVPARGGGMFSNMDRTAFGQAGDVGRRWGILGSCDRSGGMPRVWSCRCVIWCAER